MFQDGEDGGAKAPMASRVDAPRAPTTNALREIAAFAGGGGGGLACCGGLGALTEGEGVVPG